MSYEERLSSTLVLRTVRNEADKERFIAFNAACNNPFEGATCACLLHHHPETTFADYCLIEDELADQVVATTCLLPWTCSYAGIDLRVAQLEMVLTHPNYRNQGLARVLIEHFLQVVKERRFDLSIVWGIPYYYRQYGYAYALDGDTCEALPVWKIPAAPPGADQPLRLRPALISDIPRLINFYREATTTVNIFVQRSPEHWHYLLEWARHPVEMLENPGTADLLGYATLQRSAQSIRILESGLAGTAEALHLLRDLKTQVAEQVLVAWPQTNPLAMLTRSLGSHTLRGGQWLLHIPDVAHFLVKIAPLLAQRLAHSAWGGWSAEITLNLFREAFKLRFVNGQLTGVDSLGFVDSSMGADGGHLCIPPEAFVRLVFGYRSLDELFDAWPDIIVKPELRHLIDVLFPPLQSYLYTPYQFMGTHKFLLSNKL